jgi:RsiW-degrading membrane proteinase PrsW (M82 family)
MRQYAMSSWILISAVIAPALFWLAYFYYKDRFQPEPFRSIALAFCLGVAAAFLCQGFLTLFTSFGIHISYISLAEGNRLQFLLYSILINGYIEELFKFLPFILILLRFKSFDEDTDGIIYASSIALGFASFENIGYLPHLEGLELFGRAFASPLTHTIFASIWGYPVGKAFLAGRSLWKTALWALAAAALCHGFFNFFTMSSSLRILSSLLILGVWIWRIRELEKYYPK